MIIIKYYHIKPEQKKITKLHTKDINGTTTDLYTCDSYTRSFRCKIEHYTDTFDIKLSPLSFLLSVNRCFFLIFTAVYLAYELTHEFKSPAVYFPCVLSKKKHERK